MRRACRSYVYVGAPDPTRRHPLHSGHITGAFQESLPDPTQHRVLQEARRGRLAQAAAVANSNRPSADAGDLPHASLHMPVRTFHGDSTQLRVHGQVETVLYELEHSI